MTPQFTTPCYVQVDDPKKRKEVCEKLEEMGYKNIAITDDVWIMTQATDNTTEYLVGYMKIAIDCSTNIDLFLALAGMCSDTDKGQWFVFIENVIQAVYDKNGQDTGARYKNHSVGDMYQCPYSDIMSSMVRRATTAEIVEHFKTKEK